MNTLKLILRLATVLILIITTQTNVAALGEAATKFQVFVPANNQSWNRYSALIVTAIEDNTTFNIVDDGMDGDTDDSFNGALSKGQTYVTLIKDNGINDDSGGGSAKQDGDYFIITSSKPVIVSIATMSENQHDWLPAVNGTSKGQQFFLYNLPTANNSQKRDINVMAYEDNTTVTLKKISTSSTSTTGFTAVDLNANNIVFQKTIDVGEDLIFDQSDGKNVLNDGETYLIETNKGVTVQYGSLHKNERESAAYVPASNGTGSGDLFHFTVPYQGKRKQEIRITSWDNNNNVELQYFKNGNWQTEKSWIIDALEHEDWVSVDGDIDEVFRVVCVSGKSVSVFAGNEIETGNGSSSDFATILPSATGIGAGNEFLAYLGSPGQENQITDPFTNQVIGRASHLYLFANEDTATVTITDETTNGTLVNQTFVIAPGRYADFYLDLAEWQAIYNGNGNPGSGNERPYVKITSTHPITVMNTNYSDDWMTYFPGVAQKDFTLQSNVFDINNTQVSDFDILDTAILISTIDFNNVQHDIVSPNIFQN